ncbi:UDP-N-acetylmuramoyl-L-alanyl-D-glutamate--2,6-diaminopimelate ligase [Caulobacter sp. S45]|uniref:UDP-N-acetylmuramoyl-L-alanyl-D-glutamate--2, 6-diaminopimelate ligase n=1 Tax=Caulobacter sp. S45 TaxID=1641861 RepID=UPI001576E3AA|nr:UDP-N-acetylmuramoyl-L-alanyl-D-glutamate--2,6-diaminopimelate ligase [Caulobacter sp. S45]
MSVRLSALVARSLPADADPLIEGVTADSRAVRPGFLFAALPGSASDGRAFIPQALAAGAAAVLAPQDTPNTGAPLVRACDARRLYALAARRLQPAEPETIVAVTGTNGKTSVATFCRQIFARLGRHAASMGTLGVQAEDGDRLDALTPPGLTTPDAAEVARLAAELARRGVSHLALEASSHGLDQRRLDGLTIKAAGFTNLSQDHLDYHGGMDAYRACKLRLFEQLTPRGGSAVLNADAADFPAFAAAAVIHGLSVMSVGETGSAIRLTARRPEPFGQRLSGYVLSRPFDLRLPLAGGFQASNALVAAGLCIAAGEDPLAVMAALEHLTGAPGRLQRVGSGPNGGEAYVDYAHTPDGLHTVLEALRPHVKRRLLVVFGAGGDRDRAKRPLMGRAAHELADICIVTDDNPRSEDPAAIRAAVMTGAPGALEVGDRRAAIRAAVEQLGEGDVLVVAGKGHEQGQTVAGVTHPFDDVVETQAALQAVHA